MSNYAQITFFAPKDSLLPGNPAKLIKGSDVDPELAAIAVAIASKLDSTSAASPTGLIGLTANNGVLSTYMRSDATPALSQAIAPTWTAVHTFSATPVFNSGITVTTAAAAFNTPGSGAGAASASLTSSLPMVLWVNSSAATDAGKWQEFVNGSSFQLRTVNDAFSASTQALAFTRSGSTITNLSFGDASANPTYSFLGTGGTAFSGPVAFTKTTSVMSDGPVLVSNSTPYVVWDNTGGGTNNRYWVQRVSGLHFQGQVFNDASGGNKSWLDVTRSASAISDVSYGNTADNPTYNFLGTGTSTFHGNVVLAAPPSGAGLTVTGVAGTAAVHINGAASTGVSQGLLITAGTNAADNAFEIADVTFSTDYFRVAGNGGVQVGSPTNGNQGVGTLNAVQLFANIGSVNSPGISFNAEATGLYRAAGGTLGLAAGGLSAGAFTSTLAALPGNITFKDEAGTTQDAGFRGVPPNAQSANYTAVMADRGKHILNSTGGSLTFTIPSNASVAYPLGTTLTFANGNGGGACTISINSDALVWSATNGTGSRTLAAGGMATAIKIAATQWLISGAGLT